MKYARMDQGSKLNVHTTLRRRPDFMYFSFSSLAQGVGRRIEPSLGIVLNWCH